MNYLVIGSNSFSGFNFVKKLLNENQKVIGVSRSSLDKECFHEKKYTKNKNFKFYKLDINYKNNQIISIVKKYKISIILNFAAQSMVPQSWENPLHWYKTNIIAQVELVEKLKNINHLKKYINFTTPEVYGSTKKWIKENNLFFPSTPYANSRSTMDNHLLMLYRNYKFPVIFTRASNVFGPGQKLYRIIPYTILCALNRKKLYLVGGGKSERSFIDIEDVSNALYKICLKGKLGATYHISTNRLIKIVDLVKLISNKLNINYKDFVIFKKENAGKDLAYKLNSNKIRNELRWKDNIDLDTGIEKVIIWVKKNLVQLNKSPQKYKHKR
tara:strand:+ start:502 stop:1485 length:984 start_codon:yes stop_codon:yes gene_type:complete